MIQRGLTIIEVLVSIIILAVVLAGGAAIYFYLTALTAQAAHKGIAIQLANSRMEQLKTKTTCAAVVSTPQTTSTIGQIVYTASSVPNLLVPFDNTVCMSSCGRVDVTVLWLEPGQGEQTVSLTTCM